jgi:hypothetical protein
LARGVADTIGDIINLSGRADTATVADEVVTLFALAGAINVGFIGVAGRGAETKVQNVSLVADASLGNGRVG